MAVVLPGGGTDGNYPTVQFAGGGGGGSGNIGANRSNTAGFQSGNGLVIFTWSGAASAHLFVYLLP
ncbi:MAG: hypothetical protein IPH46_09230 [Bacteroidetes bacterium]|nr:hypothetical protein [Bacteroidota bacterium]